MDVQETDRTIKAIKTTKVVGKPAYRGTEAKLRVMLEHYARLGRLLPACKEAGIDYSFHFRRMRSDPVYRAAVEEVEQTAAQRQEDNITAMADDGDLQAALALLRRFRPQYYRERASVEVSGSIDLVERMKIAEQRLITLKRNDLPVSAS